MTVKGNHLRVEITSHAAEFGKNYQGEMANFKNEYLSAFRGKFGNYVRDPEVTIGPENIEIVGKFYVYTQKDKKEQFKTEKSFRVSFKIIQPTEE